jgi:hypothetical protein
MVQISDPMTASPHGLGTFRRTGGSSTDLALSQLLNQSSKKCWSLSLLNLMFSIPLSRILRGQVRCYSNAGCRESLPGDQEKSVKQLPLVLCALFLVGCSPKPELEKPETLIGLTFDQFHTLLPDECSQMGRQWTLQVCTTDHYFPKRLFSGGEQRGTRIYFKDNIVVAISFNIAYYPDHVTSAGSKLIEAYGSDFKKYNCAASESLSDHFTTERWAFHRFDVESVDFPAVGYVQEREVTFSDKPDVLHPPCKLTF